MNINQSADDLEFLNSFAFDEEEDDGVAVQPGAPVLSVQQAALGPNPTMTSNTNQVTIKTSVDLPVYSGHPVNTKYTGKDGTCTELSRVQDWLFEINKIGKAGGWTPEIMATQAAMKLVPGSPAANWMKVVEQSGDAAKIAEVSTWDSFCKAMIREFGAPADFGSLVALLNSFKQEQNELVRDFYNRLVLGYNEFTLSLPDAFTGDPWDNETRDDQLKKRKATMDVVTNFHLKAFFVSGLKAEIRKEVIKSGPDNIDDILTMAKRLEQAKLQEKKNGPLPGSTITAAALNSAVNARLAELGFGPAPVVAAAGAKPKEGQSKRRERQGDVICFYCGGSHLASKCEQRAADRARGVWRPTVRCPESTKAQWDGMTKEDRQKGARLFGKASSAAANAPPTQQPGQQQGGVATVIPGLSYSTAAGGPLESAYAAYQRSRQGN